MSSWEPMDQLCSHKHISAPRGASLPSSQTQIKNICTHTHK